LAGGEEPWVNIENSGYVVWLRVRGAKSPPAHEVNRKMLNRVPSRNKITTATEGAPQGASGRQGLRVCFVSHSANLQGAERSLLELVEALRTLGVEAYVVLPSKGPFVDALRDRKVPYAIIPFMLWMGKPSTPWKTALRITSHPISILIVGLQLKRWHCDLVYTNTLSVCVGAFAARLVALPHVWQIHEFQYQDHGMAFYLGERVSLRLVDRLSAACLAVSNAVAQKYAPYISPPKLKMIYQSVCVPEDPSPAHDSSPPEGYHGIRCVIVGSLHRGKGQEDAIQAIPELARLGIEAELWVVGDGDARYRKYLRDLARANGLDNTITFMGYVDNPAALIKSAEVLLVCSRSEAFSRVAIEAMLLGKPVIGTRSGGTAELIHDGFNGLSYPAGDFRALAEKIKYVHDYPANARQMGKNGQAWAAERFGQDRYGVEILSVFRQLTR